MALPDINVLVAVAVASDPRHRSSKAWLDGAMADGDVALLAETVSGFVRVLSLPEYGVSPAECVRWLEGLTATQRVQLARPSHRQLHRFCAFMSLPTFRGRDATDAMLAAAALDLDATLVTWDTGFSRFPALRWYTPDRRQPVTNPV